MSERPPIDVEATAASILNGVMITLLCLAGVGIGIGFATQRFGDLKLVGTDRGLMALGALGNGVVTTVVCASFAWGAIKSVGRLPVRKTPPAPPIEPLSREDLIRQAPWTGRGSGGNLKPITLASVAWTVGLVAIFVIAWRLPEPYREWMWMGLVISAAVMRLIDLALGRRK
jgi:hypothetical protein